MVLSIIAIGFACFTIGFTLGASFSEWLNRRDRIRTAVDSYGSYQPYLAGVDDAELARRVRSQWAKQRARNA